MDKEMDYTFLVGKGLGGKIYFDMSISEITDIIGPPDEIQEPYRTEDIETKKYFYYVS